MKTSSLIFLFFLTIFSGYTVMVATGKMPVNILNGAQWQLINSLSVPIVVIVLFVILYMFFKRVN